MPQIHDIPQMPGVPLPLIIPDLEKIEIPSIRDIGKVEPEERKVPAKPPCPNCGTYHWPFVP